MLYGNLSFVESFINVVNDFSNKNNIIPIYAANVGSISRGIEFSDSDYDTRILYLDKNNVQLDTISIPINLKDSDIRKRLDSNVECLKSGTMYEGIPFWELTSFFQFLKLPAIDGKVSNGLYNVFEWTLFSPYVWDPYGLQPKITLLVNSVFRPKYLLDFHKNVIENYFSQEDGISIKDYLQSIFSALAIDWIIKRNSFYPMYLPSLISVLEDNSLRSKILALVDKGKKDSFIFSESNPDAPYGYLHNRLMTKHDSQIDYYISRMQQVKEIDCSVSLDKIDNVLNQIYEIIRKSISENRIC